MPEASVVVLNGDAEGRYRGELCRILEPAFAVEVHDLPWGGALPIPLTDPGPAPIPPAPLPHQDRPELAFILAPGGSVAPTLSLVERVRRAQPTLPLIGVIDTPHPFEVEGLLTAGITDFVTPPLRSVDLLPRVRRLLAHTGTRNPLRQVRRAGSRPKRRSADLCGQCGLRGTQPDATRQDQPDQYQKLLRYVAKKVNLTVTKKRDGKRLVYLHGLKNYD